jgi:hypothetical protein
METLVPDGARRAVIDAEMPQVPLVFFESPMPVPVGWCEGPVGGTDLRSVLRELAPNTPQNARRGPAPRVAPTTGRAAFAIAAERHSGASSPLWSVALNGPVHMRHGAFRDHVPVRWTREMAHARHQDELGARDAGGK